MTQTTQHPTPERLSAFVDGELPTSEASEIQEHLGLCHPCSLHVLSTTRLKAATARTAQRFAPPPETLARLAAQLRPAAGHALPDALPPGPQTAKTPARLFGFHSVRWVAMAAALLLVASLFGWHEVHRENALSAELLDQHLATLSDGAAPEVLSSDRHTVKPWFQGRLPFSFNLPAALPADTTLKGADLTYLNGRPAALLLFAIQKHEVSIFLTQRTAGPAIGLPSATRSGFTFRHASTPGLEIDAVSDVNPAQLDLLISAVVNAQSPG